MKKLGIAGLILAGGLGLAGRSIGDIVVDGGEIMYAERNSPQETQDIYHKSVEMIREERRYQGVDVPKGTNGRDIAKFFFSSEEVWPALLDSNIARGNIGYVQTLLEAPDPLSWNGINYVPNQFHALRAGDHLELPQQIEYNGVTYKFQPIVPADQINLKIEDPNIKTDFSFPIKRTNTINLGDMENQTPLSSGGFSTAKLPKCGGCHYSN
ncbi:hypothetical protein HY212_00690 [Candidatus Pacearchaeota archaeon]|nr:hypothetical protein [Candidatus Pacearchaeota archaeon]